MSAIAFVCKSESVEILTDTLSIDAESGCAADLSGKQVFIGQTGVIALMGWQLPGDIFAQLALAQCDSFDDLVMATPELWALVGSAVRAEFPSERFRYDPFVYQAAIVGWSEERRRGEAYMFDSLTGGSVGRSITAFSMGGGEASMPETLAFIRHFHRVPDEFEAEKDGRPLFESMRRAVTTLGDQSVHTVGGAIHHSVIDRTGIKTSVVHTWSTDSIGALVEAA